MGKQKASKEGHERAWGNDSVNVLYESFRIPVTDACGLCALPSRRYKYSIVFGLLKSCCALEAGLHSTNSESFLQGNALPLTDRCLHVTVGSGLPIARHSRVTLLPSFTVTSEEMFMIWGGTGKRQRRRGPYEKDSLQKGRHQPHTYSNTMV